MSHLHLPDGVLPWWVWLGGLVVSVGLVLVGLKKLEKERRLLPAVAVMAAVALVATNIPLGLPLHMNLSALAGIILGPVLGFLALFLVNLFNSLVSHGGLTVLGINSLLVGSEALIAGGLFILLGGGRRLLANSAVSVVAALLVSTLLMVAVAGLAGVELEALADHNHDHVHGHDHVPVDSQREHGFLESFVKLIAPLVAVWVAVELALTLLVVGYVNKVKGGWFARG